MSVPHTVPHGFRSARIPGPACSPPTHRERDTTVPLPLWDRPLARAKCLKLDKPRASARQTEKSWPAVFAEGCMGA